MTALVTMYHGEHVAFRPVTEARLRAYAEVHGYEYREAQVLPDAHPKWSKLPALRQALVDHEVAVWFDADVLVIDPSGVPPVDEHITSWLTILYDQRYGVSSAVVGLRAGPVAREFLEAAYARRHDPYTDGDRDQRAIRELLLSGAFPDYTTFSPDWAGDEGWSPPGAHLVHGCFQWADTPTLRAEKLSNHG